MEFYMAMTAIVAILLILVYKYFQRSYKYWDNKKIPSMKPVFPYGNTGNPFTDRTGFNNVMQDLYFKFKSKGIKYGGFYAGATPNFMFVDPSDIKMALTKDFHHFTGHGTIFDAKTDPLARNLFNMDGKEWKHMREKLTPTFTSGKMKMMFYIILACGEQLKEQISNLHEHGNAIDIKEALSCFTTDVIGSCAFGLDCNSFKYPGSGFRLHAKLLFAGDGFRLGVRRMLTMMAPALVKAFKIRFFNDKITNFFIGIVDNVVKQREEKKITRNDFIQLMVELRREAMANGEDPLTVKEMAAQAFVFFLAGFETSSTTMTWCLYELAHNQEIQDKVRDEINRTFEKYGKLTYEAITEMKYLHQVVYETLRKYPSVPTLPRLCTQNYRLSGNQVIEKGTKVFISLLGIHNDPEYFPNPDKFCPDRFSKENETKITPFTFMPFGEGPRYCIGFRFGLVQTKVGLSLLMRSYRLRPHESVKYPMGNDPKQFFLTPKGPILLTTEKL